MTEDQPEQEVGEGSQKKLQKPFFLSPSFFLSLFPSLQPGEGANLALQQPVLTV